MDGMRGNKIVKVLKDEILTSISPRIGEIIMSAPIEYINKLEEIRIRLGKPLMINCGRSDYMLSPKGRIPGSIKDAYIVSKDDCERTIQLLSNYSVYSLEEELKCGYITLQGGHRVGIAGKGIIEGGKIKALKNISGFNIRIARQVIGAADSVMKYIMKKDDIYNTIIISPPQCGKTTLLRDMIRQISSGNEKAGIKGLKVSLVDERSEVAGCYLGIPQNDVGIRTDILDACPKSAGLIMMIRSMSPQVLATDEIGSIDDIKAIYEAMNAGIRMVTTIHGDGIDDVLKRPYIDDVIKNRIFERIIILSSKHGPGTIEDVIDGRDLKSIID